MSSTDATLAAPRTLPGTPPAAVDLPVLEEIERKVRWLATWTIHHANHIRPSRDGIKVGGHQASCASLTTIMTALYMQVLRPSDRARSSHTPVRC